MLAGFFLFLMPQTKVSEIQVSYRPAIGRKPIIVSALDVVTEALPFFKDGTLALQEQFLAMYVNRANRLLGVYPMSMGGITGTSVDIRLILSVALKIVASGLILVHNHPSGNLQPSQSDKEMTERIQEACQYFEIPVLDHVIIDPEHRYFSFAENGLLKSF